MMLEICKRFQEIELQFKDLKIRETEVWHVIRMHIYNAVIEECENPGEAHPDEAIEMSKGTKLKSGIQFLGNALWHHPRCRLKKGKDWLIVCTPRKIAYKGTYIYPIIEPALRILKGNFNYVERPNHFRHIKDEHTKCVAYSDGIELIRAVNQITGKYRMNEEEKKKINSILDVVDTEFQIKLNRTKLNTRIQECMTGFFTYYKAYGKILDRIKPKYVMEVVHYENAELALTKAAHERGIQVVELQHGIMGPMHISYNLKYTDEYLPDKLIGFGDYWKDCTSYPGEMISVGYPYLEECVEQLQRGEKRKNILFISQGPIAKDLIKLALELEKYFTENQCDYQIIYKLHPNEYSTWKNLYPELQKSGIQVIDNNEKSLYEYFADAFCQIGVFSTALYEGVAFGLKTIIVKAFSYERVQDLIDGNYAVLVEGVEETIAAIEDENIGKYEVDSFWKKHAMENMRRVLTTQIVEEK